MPLETTDPSVILAINLPRWIMASARSFFVERTQFKMFFEHLGDKNLKETNGRKIDNYTEFRLDGPYARKITKSETFYDIEVNVLCTSITDSLNADNIERVLGDILAIFTIGYFPIFKYGDHDVDDQSQIGCMLLQQGHNEEVVVSRFGQANPDTRLNLASVEGHYRMRLTL